MLEAEKAHRANPNVEQVIADLENGPLAHLPEGRFWVTSGWLVCAVMASNLMLSALAGPTWAGCAELGHGPAGSSFWEAASGEVGRGAAQDLVLHLQPALVAAQVHQFVLVAAGSAVHNTVVDVGLLAPAAHRLHRDVEVSSDLGMAQIPSAGDPDDVTLELGREPSWAR